MHRIRHSLVSSCAKRENYEPYVLSNSEPGSARASKSGGNAVKVSIAIALAILLGSASVRAQCTDPNASGGVITCWALKPDPSPGETIRVIYGQKTPLPLRLAVFRDLALITNISPGEKLRYIEGWQGGELQYAFEINTGGSWVYYDHIWLPDVKDVPGGKSFVLRPQDSGTNPANRPNSSEVSVAWGTGIVSFQPSPPCPQGTLITQAPPSKGATIWIIVDGYKRAIGNWGTFIQCEYKYSDVKAVSDVNQYPDGPPLINNGMFLTTAEPTVYLMENGTRRGVPNPSTLRCLNHGSGDLGANVARLDPTTIMYIPEASGMPPLSCGVVCHPGCHKVYIPCGTCTSPSCLSGPSCSIVQCGTC
jgi:hypothetical protein